MTIQINILELIFLIAIVTASAAGVNLIARDWTKLARWAGLCVLSLALELGCYLLQLLPATARGADFLILIQVVGYTLFCFFWLLFVFAFSRHSHWIRPRNLAVMLVLPAIYLPLMVARLIQGGLPEPSEVGSFFLSPVLFGAPGILLFIFCNGIGLISAIILAQFYAKSNAFTRKLLLPLLLAPLCLDAVGMLEAAGINPVRPYSPLQLACIPACFLSLVVVVDLRFRSISSSARETVIDQMQDGVLILDLQDRIVDLNPAARQIIGLGSEQPPVKGKISDLWPEGAGWLAGHALPELPKTARVNGLELTFDINDSQLLDAYREPQGRVIVLRNVTGRERMEKALTERTQQLWRTNAFLSGLAEANLRLQTTTDPSQIIAILGDELKKLGLVCFVARLDPEAHELRVSYLSTPPEIIGRIEKVLGLEIAGFRLDRDQFAPLYRILESNEMSFEKFHSSDLAYGPGKLPAAILEQIIRASGLEPDMASLVLPLVTGARTLGLMGVWGPSLSEADIAPFRIFASQVAHMLERAILHEAEIRRSSELARANSLVIALSKVASQVGTTTNSALVLDTLGKELSQVRLNCAVVSIDPAGEMAVIKYVSFSPKLIEQIEKLTGLQINNRAIPKQFWPGVKIFSQPQPIWYPHPNQIIHRMFPMVPEGIAKQAFRLLGVSDVDQLCILPLVFGERTIGALLIWGSDLKPDDSPILSVFANQVAGIMQNVTNYEHELQRKNELARSNATILALSNVAARLDTATDLSQVYDALGAQLKKLRLNCLIGTLDAAQQLLKFEYLSVKAEVVGWLGRLGAFLPKEVLVPRRLWPSETTVVDKAPYWDSAPVDTAAKVFPFLPSQVVLRAFETAGMKPDAPACYLPMISEEVVIGILVVWGPELRPEDMPGLSVFANQVATATKNARLFDQAQQEIIERTQAEARIQAALSEKEVLLKEVHHRVKNNLQVISSLLSLQAAQITDPQTVEALRESQNRVRSMALIHEKLYQSPDLARVEFADYLKRLVNSLGQTYRGKSNRVTLRVQADDIALNIDTAIPCGLIVNELVSNSLKHAFPAGHAGTIEVACRRSPAGGCTLSVGDDGVGLPAGLDITRSPSLGLKLVNSLVQQIGGELEVRGNPGACYEIRFKES